MHTRFLLLAAWAALAMSTQAQDEPKVFFQSTEMVTPEYRPEWYTLYTQFGKQDIGGQVDQRMSMTDPKPPAATFLCVGADAPDVRVTFRVVDGTAKEGVDFIVPNKNPIVLDDSRFGTNLKEIGQIPIFILDRQFPKRRSFVIELLSAVTVSGGFPVTIDPARAKCTVTIYGVKTRR